MRIKFRFGNFHIILLFILIFSAAFLAREIFGDTNNNKTEPLLHIFEDITQNVEAQTPQTAYVANDAATCGSYSPCFINTVGVDGPNGLGTGLRQAVSELNNGDEIIILGNYTIKDHTVLIDKNLTIRGLDDAAITYNGDDCSLPMLSMTSGGSLQDLTINSGNCPGLSRDLISINSTQDLQIKTNTLEEGNRAINIIQNDGRIDVSFNHITNNREYAIFQEPGSGNGFVDIYANNIFGNRSGAQVNCNTHGSADHNYWGAGILPTDAAVNCETTDGKRLGAPIATDSNAAGVQAIRQNVIEDFQYAFNDNIGIRRNAGNNYDLIIVNHGQGDEDNIPFLNSGSSPIVACSNFYDVFLANGAVASDLVLSIKYDLNSECISTIESSDFCSQDNTSQYPLWWYDPLNNITDKWDRTGQIPEGDNPLNKEGQTTTCEMSTNEIQVVIDSSGKPGIIEDLGFTPFAAGLPVGTSNITAFDAYLDVDEVDIYWETELESKISGYHVLRANSETGPYYRISSFISSIGSNSIYEFTDSLESVEFNKNYYYKIEIINIYGDTLRTHGPLSILTSTPTPTKTQTRTQTPTRTLYPTRTPYPTSTKGPTRTATLYIYRSPTSIYRPYTSTPYGTPTQVRTDRSSPTGTLSSVTITAVPSLTPSPHSTQITPESISPTSTEDSRSRTMTPYNTSTDIPAQEGNSDTHDQINGPKSLLYLAIGSTTGLGLLGAVGVYFYKKYIL